MQMVITVNGIGVVETILKDEKFDTKFLGGKREIERISDIKHSDIMQKFYILWLKGPYSGLIHTYKMDQRIFNAPVKGVPDDIMYFPDYQIAVDWEVRCINMMRLKGISFADETY